MTLVLTAMTDDHIFVVSDRRMTDARNGRVLSSTENKAVILNSEMVLTYTGFCNLEGLPTDAWVANILRDQPVETWLRTLLNRIGPAVRAIQVKPELQRHAFLLTGYAKTLRGRQAFRPLGFLISNFHGPDGRTLDTPEASFWLSRLPLGNWRARVDSIGRDLSKERRLVLEKAIRAQLRATPDKPQRVLEILGAEVRQVARRDRGVGGDLMAVSFPLKAVGSGPSMALDPTAVDRKRQLVTIYAGTDSAPVSYGPTYVNPGVQILGLSVTLDPNVPPRMHRLITRQPY